MLQGQGSQASVSDSDLGVDSIDSVGLGSKSGQLNVNVDNRTKKLKRNRIKFYSRRYSGDGVRNPDKSKGVLERVMALSCRCVTAANLPCIVLAVAVIELVRRKHYTN